MSHFLALIWFHFKNYARTSYFILLPIGTTFSLLLMQYIIIYGNQSAANVEFIWIRAGIFGMWASVVTSSGMIGFQRYQGTLSYLLNSALGDRLSLIALMLAPSTFGLIAFPFAYMIALLLHIPVSDINVFLLMHLLMFWLSASFISFLLACFSIFTRNALVYEQLINTPLLLLSGLLPLPSLLDGASQSLRWLIPIAPTITLLLGSKEVLLYIQFVVGMLFTLIFAYYLSGYLLTKAKYTGQLGMLQ